MSASTGRDFDSSEKGTKEYWDNCYEREISSFGDTGDVGEIWFGEDSQERVLDWMEDCTEIKHTDRILDLGCGNGIMLIELAKKGYTDLVGVDYSEGAIKLAESITQTEGIEGIEYHVVDLLKENIQDSYTCLTRPYKVCHDKGTYDAISLMPGDDVADRLAYIQTVKSLLSADGLFIITSCNWTKDQLINFFQKDFDLHSSIKTPSFKFGGQTGNTVTSLIFKLKS